MKSRERSDVSLSWRWVRCWRGRVGRVVRISVIVRGGGICYFVRVEERESVKVEGGREKVAGGWEKLSAGKGKWREMR